MLKGDVNFVVIVYLTAASEIQATVLQNTQLQHALMNPVPSTEFCQGSGGSGSAQTGDTCTSENFCAALRLGEGYFICAGPSCQM